MPDLEQGSPEIIERACAVTAAVLGTLSATDLGRPTPCRSWAVRDVINHVVSSAGWYAHLAETGEMAEFVDESPDVTGGDFQAAFGAAAARVSAAFGAPGAMDKIMQMPFGGIPGSVCVWIAAGDIFTHGWDLAKAAGQSSDLDPGFAERLLAQIRQLLPDAMRGAEGQAPFGPAVELPASAPAADRLAAFEGRQP
jgi:uncharacterized protein (TIGR03086 family)